MTLMGVYVCPGSAGQTRAGPAGEGHHRATSAEGFGREGAHGGGGLKLYLCACVGWGGMGRVGTVT